MMCNVDNNLPCVPIYENLLNQHDFPEEMLEHIFTFILDHPSLTACKDYGNISLVCTRFRRIISPNLNPLTKFINTLRPFFNMQEAPPFGDFRLELLLHKDGLNFAGVCASQEIFWLETTQLSERKEDLTHFKVMRVMLRWYVITGHWYSQLKIPQIYVDNFDHQINSKIQKMLSDLVQNAVNFSKAASELQNTEKPLNCHLEAQQNPTKTLTDFRWLHLLADPTISLSA